jgi:hypothetical protein
MKTLSKLVSTSSVSLLVITSPVLISGSHKKANLISYINTTAVSSSVSLTSSISNKAANFKAVSYVAGNDAVTNKKVDLTADAAAKKAFEVKMVMREASSIYTDMNLRKSGLNQRAFEYAWRGYHNLLKKGILAKTNVLSICDFTQSSRSRRLYIIDVQNKKLLINTYVAHGMNSGVDYATSFSNQAESFKTSLGFYMTKKAYVGRNGLSLRIAGLEKGYNDLAAKRNIVIHGADYIGTEYLKANGEMGRSLGCTAVPKQINNKIIHTIKNGSAWFIYYPAKKYLNDSAVING